MIRNKLHLFVYRVYNKYNNGWRRCNRTIIPWAVIPVAAICGVEPADLVRKNIIPVIAGFTATIIVAIIIL
ncbi:hypothetical protein [Anaerobium acetethylicum]|uniref:hypothetical protein n=1 Tax=Anaerobium acetethylicum TaxID=1619234 RepID=UPI001A9A6DEA|nr:hypothetical protein [Anaerobium acetethylicum]